jgi:hypothetical protein
LSNQELIKENMKLSAFLLAPTAIMATTLCPVETIQTDADGVPHFCGGGLDTNCDNFSDGTNFCGLMVSGTAPAAFIASVCCSDDGTDESEAAHAVAELDTCGSCLEDNDPTDTTTTLNQWDGANCFNAGAAPVFPNTNIVFSNGAVITDAADCQMSCHRLDFYGTCWKRCGARGWGVDPALYPRYGGYGGAYGGYYGGYGQGGYYGGAYGQGGYYGGAYGQGGYYGGAYGQGGYYGAQQQSQYGYPYGTVPSVAGSMCADPARLENIEEQAPNVAPVFPPPFPGGYYGGAYGQGGMYGGAYGGMYGGAYGGMYGGAYGGMYGGAYGQPIYGRQAYIGSVGVGGVYGGGASIYGGSTIYGGSVYGGSVYGAGVATPTKANRCSPTIQCSCDLDCCDRGDCCDDYMQEGCAFNASD